MLFIDNCQAPVELVEIEPMRGGQTADDRHIIITTNTGVWYATVGCGGAKLGKGKDQSRIAPEQPLAARQVPTDKREPGSRSSQ